MYPGAGPMSGMPPSGPVQHGMGPHAPMNSPMQQQRRIDPDQMPSPVSITLQSLQFQNTFVLLSSVDHEHYLSVSSPLS